jgi:peptidoglycan/LPS O-acetylase OafA/YrhL
MNAPPSHRQPRGAKLRHRFTVAALGSLALALPAAAHPGHSVSSASTAHLLTSPDHIVAPLAAGMAFILVSLFIAERIPRRSLQTLGAVAAVGGALLLTLRP